MEFKGTKGKWCLKLHDGKYWKVINENNETICNVNSKSTLKIKEEQANAQLIAHAPKMLEMLIKIVDAQYNPLKTLANLNNAVSQAQELIKKATTI